MPDTSIHVDHLDPRLEACRRLTEHTGVTVEIVPVVDDLWIATAARDSILVEAAAGLRPLVAALHLAEHFHDAHPCPHCGRPTCVDDRLEPDRGDSLNPDWCEVGYDPDVGEYRRACTP